MPVDKKYPFELAEWEAITDEGLEMRVLHVEDLLPFIALGHTATEISKDLQIPMDIIEHTIMLIPDMMAWREEQQVSVAYRQLPRKNNKSTSTPS